MKKLFLLLCLLLATTAAAQQPRVIITQGGNDVNVTAGNSLQIDVKSVNGTTVTGMLAGSVPVTIVQGAGGTDNTTGSTALAGSGQTINVSLAGERGAVFQLQSGGTLVATITPKCSFDGGTLYNVNGYIQDPVTGAVTLTATIASAQATTDYPVICPQGASHAQMNVTAFTSGSANFVARATVVTWPAVGWGVVTTSAPTYTTGLIAPVSLTTAGALRTDSSAVTQPISGTVQPGNTQNTTAWLVTGAPSAVAAGAATIFYNQAVTTEQTVKASGGNLYGLDVYNPNSSVCYLQIFNTTSATLGSTTPILSIPVTNGVATFWSPGPIGVANFSTAIGVASTTGAQNATTCTTGMTVNVWYQ